MFKTVTIYMMVDKILTLVPFIKTKIAIKSIDKLNNITKKFS